MNNYDTIIIIDWDDTLMATTWLIQHQIPIQSPIHKPNNIKLFAPLDNILFKLFIKILKYKNTKVIIVTNAMMKWIHITLEMLPKTKKLLFEYIEVISARDLYQKKYPGNGFLWKKLVFEQIVDKYLGNKKIQNIISIGDAEYEFRALLDLFDGSRYLKSIRMIPTPSYEYTVDQLNVLNENFDKIYNKRGHVDLVFGSK